MARPSVAPTPECVAARRPFFKVTCWSVGRSTGSSIDDVCNICGPNITCPPFLLPCILLPKPFPPVQTSFINGPPHRPRSEWRLTGHLEASSSSLLVRHASVEMSASKKRGAWLRGRVALFGVIHGFFARFCWTLKPQEWRARWQIPRLRMM